MNNLSIRLALALEEFIDAASTECAQHFRMLAIDDDCDRNVERVRLGRLAGLRWRLAHEFLWLLQSDATRLRRPTLIEVAAPVSAYIQGGSMQ